jgi:hypothetical protein
MRLKGMLAAAMVACVVSGPLAAANKGAALDVRKPAGEQLAEIRSQLGDGKTYSEISAEDRSKVQVALARMELVLNGKSGVDELNGDQKVAVFNDQELVNSLLTKARDDSRMVCRREKQVGSNMPTNQCQTVAERRRQMDSNQRDFTRMQQSPGMKNN